MEKQGPPAYDDVGNLQSGPSFAPGTYNHGEQPPEYVPPAQCCRTRDPLSLSDTKDEDEDEDEADATTSLLPYAQQPYTDKPFPTGQQAGGPSVYPAGVHPVAVYKAQPPGATFIMRQPTGPMPKDYLIFAILVTFCCSLPCGIVAIMKATGTKNHWHAGDMEGAIRNSKEAKKWVLISLVSGIIANVCVTGFLILYFAFIFSNLPQ